MPRDLAMRLAKSWQRTARNSKKDSLDSIQQAQDLALEKVNEAQVRFETINKESKELLTRLQSIGQSTLEAEKEILAVGVEETKEAVEGVNTFCII